MSKYKNNLLNPIPPSVFPGETISRVFFLSRANGKEENLSGCKFGKKGKGKKRFFETPSLSFSFALNCGINHGRTEERFFFLRRLKVSSKEVIFGAWGPFGNKIPRFRVPKNRPSRRMERKLPQQFARKRCRRSFPIGRGFLGREKKRRERWKK